MQIWKTCKKYYRYKKGKTKKAEMIKEQKCKIGKQNKNKLKLSWATLKSSWK